jgi:hypothetical protein
MELVRIDEAGENAWLATSAAEILAGRFAFIGATDAVEEGTWRWVTGDTAFWLGDSDGMTVAGAYQNWSANKPFGNTTRNCAGMRLDGTWEDRSCTAETPYFCESL